MTKSRFSRSPDSGSPPLPPAADRRPRSGNGPTMKDQLGNAISTSSLAVGRDNGVTALRHDTPINVSEVEDEVMAGSEILASISSIILGYTAILAGENDRGVLSRARERRTKKMRRERERERWIPEIFRHELDNP